MNKPICPTCTNYKPSTHYCCADHIQLPKGMFPLSCVAHKPKPEKKEKK